MSDWTCAECDYENEAKEAACEACSAARPAAAAASASGTGKDDDNDNDDIMAGKVVGKVLQIEDVAGKPGLKQLLVDCGEDAPRCIVTNAPNVDRAGQHVVVAKSGEASIAGEKVKTVNVGGVASAGMLCNAEMLGWKGGGATTAALVPESCAPGSRPPESRPRMN